MTDIHQWRRMIQPTRTRTPAIDQDEGDGIPPSSPTTPKRGLRPKLSSYFSGHGAAGNSIKAETSSAFLSDDILPSWPITEPFPLPAAEGLIDSLMCRLLSEPYRSLDTSFNSVLMHIFESYRTLNDEKEQLQVQLADQVSNHKAAIQKLRYAQKQWQEERKTYKAEIKRLEVLLSKGKRGVAEVTLARQDSLVRKRNDENSARTGVDNDGLETVFEFLEKTTRHDDGAWSNQRATFRTRRASPSAQERRLSRQLASKKSMTNIHADLPFGTPPDALPGILAEASRFEAVTQPAGERKREELGAKPALTSFSEPKTSFSDESLSTFSCDGDLLPDEAADVNLVDTGGTDHDLAAVKRIANVLARRRNIDVATVLPKLMNIFNAQSVDLSRDATSATDVTNVPRMQDSAIQPAVGEKSTHADGIQKHSSLMQKASSLFKKAKPQLKLDTTVPAQRFSFETGDDAFAISTPTYLHEPTSGASRERLLRKSASMSSLPAIANQVVLEDNGTSAVAHSATTSAPVLSSPKTSSISSPVQNSGSTSGPGGSREDSASSLVTAIMHSEHGIRGIDSTSNSPRDPSLAHHLDLSSRCHQRKEAPGGNQHRSTSSDLRDHLNALHGNSFAAAAARAASAGYNASKDHSDVHHTNAGTQPGSSVRQYRRLSAPSGRMSGTASTEDTRSSAPSSGMGDES